MSKRCSKFFGNGRSKSITTEQAVAVVLNESKDKLDLEWDYSDTDIETVHREDEENSEGGSWTLKCKKQDTEDVWKQLLLAAIGEQFSDCMAEDDEVIGASVSIRDRDDLILIWNRYACFKDQSTVIAKLQELLPHVGFSTMFYKAFSMHEAFEGKKAHKGQS